MEEQIPINPTWQALDTQADEAQVGKMANLIQDIWELSAESHYTPEDMEATDHGLGVFRRYGEQVLALFEKHHPLIELGYLATAGIECNAMAVVATLPPNAPIQDHLIPRSTADKLFARGEKVLILRAAEAASLPGEVTSAGERLVLKLVGNGEFFGFICLDTKQAPYWNRLQDELTAISRAVCRCVSEAIFSMRLEALAAPFVFTGGHTPPEDEIYDQICRQATLGLGADGAILRIHDERTNQLMVCGRWGKIAHHPEEANGPGERICRRVFEDTLYGTARTIATGKGFGVEITKKDEEQLRAAGIGSYMVMRLQSDITVARVNAKLGTLAVFHYRTQEFSLRDIRLFRGYSERIADDLEVIAQKRRLEEMSTLMRSQFNVLTRAEMISLLAHDVGHKAIQATEKVMEFIEATKKAIRERQSFNFNAIAKEAGDAQDACQRVENEFAQIKQITKQVDEVSVPFFVKKVLEDIKRDFAAVLDRNNMGLEIIGPGNPECYGPRRVFEQVIFNLVINSIDAQKTLRHPRKNLIHVHCREEKGKNRQRIIIQFWDDGPGISFQHFPEPKDIFLLGRTSKPEGQGTGTGLPMSQSLLSKFFRGDLQLRDRKKALFEICMEP